MTKNTRLLLTLIAIGFAMLGLSYAFVPLYRTFCQLLGIPVPTIAVGQEGAPKNTAPPPGEDARTITVRFMGNQANQIPVNLSPVHKKIRMKIGEPVLTAYTATNTSHTAMDGVAVHTIIGLGSASADDMSPHIELQQCFCFEEQHYPAKQEVTLPLSFTIAPTLPQGVHTLTFGYTLFQQEN